VTDQAELVGVNQQSEKQAARGPGRGSRPVA
jgi:hypothetical protein